MTLEHNSSVKYKCYPRSHILTIMFESWKYNISYKRKKGKNIHYILILRFQFCIMIHFSALRYDPWTRLRSFCLSESFNLTHVKDFVLNLTMSPLLKNIKVQRNIECLYISTFSLRLRGGNQFSFSMERWQCNTIHLTRQSEYSAYAMKYTSRISTHTHCCC